MDQKEAVHAVKSSHDLVPFLSEATTDNSDKFLEVLLNVKYKEFEVQTYK